MSQRAIAVVQACVVIIVLVFTVALAASVIFLP